VVIDADGVIGALDALALTNGGRFKVTMFLLEAVCHIVEHFGMHTGQIIAAKARSGDLRCAPPTA
jgi:hypothetical protein